MKEEKERVRRGEIFIKKNKNSKRKKSCDKCQFEAEKNQTAESTLATEKKNHQQRFIQ